MLGLLRFSLTPRFGRMKAMTARHGAVSTASRGRTATERETVETVQAQQRRAYTPLKWGVNEKLRSELPLAPAHLLSSLMAPRAARCLALSVAIASGAFRAADSPASHPPAPLPGAELFTDGAVHPIRLEISRADLRMLRQTPRRSVRATVRAGGQVYRAVAVHLKGATGSFRPVDDKPGLTLNFARFNAGQRFCGLQRVHLNNSVEDPSYLNEQLGSELFRAAGVPAPRVAHARVWLNGRQLGLYVLKEGFTEDFLGGYFRRTDGSLYSPDWGHDVDQPMKLSSGRDSGPGQPDLKALAEAAAEPDANRRWERLTQVLDIDRFLSFMALEIMLGHRDGYCLARNNFRIYHDADTGKFVFLPHGMDQLLGKADFPWKPHLAGVVARAIMDTPEGRRRYAERFAALFDDLFKVESLTSRVDALLRQLRPELTRGEFRQLAREAAVVKERIVQRQLNLKWQLSQPELALLKFDGGVARPADWVKVDEPRGEGMDRGNSPDGRPALHVVAGPATTASWRAKVLLPRGRYRFEGRGMVAAVKPLPFGQHQGAGLRVSGRTRSAGGLTGDSDWQPLSVEFQVQAPTEAVELICELRASAGQFWVDLGSLRLAQIQSAADDKAAVPTRREERQD